MNLRISVIFSLLFVALLAFNCTNSEVPSVMDSKVFSAQEADGRSTLSIEQLKKDPLFVSLIKSQKLDDIFEEKTSVVTLDKYTFKISLKSINKFQREDYVSYTFTIDRGKDSKGLIENLVIENNKGKEESYILSYQPDKEWILGYANNKSPDFKGKVGKEVLGEGRGRNSRVMTYCSRTYIWIITTCPRFTRAPGDKLDMICDDEVKIISIEECGFEGGGSGFYDPQGESGLPSGGGGGGYTVLNGLDADNMAVTLIKYFLGIPPYDPMAPTGIDWFGENPEAAKDLLLYLVANNFSPQAEAFGNWAKNLIYANGESGVEVVRYTIELLNQDPNLNELVVMDVVANQSSYRERMAAAEKTIFDTLAWYQKIAYLASAEQAASTASNWYPSSTVNGLGDAFRHAYWNALCVKRLGESLTISLTNAHETAYDPTTYEYYWKDRDMDLFNNSVGRSYGTTSYISLPASIKLYALEAGSLRYLSPLGAYVGPDWVDHAANASSVLKPTNE